MKIIVKSAHFYLRECFARESIRRNLSKLLGNRNYALSYQATCQLYKNKDEHMVRKNIFDPIYPQCTEEEKKIIQTCIRDSRITKKFGYKVTLSTEPTLTVGALKTLLIKEPWIPKKNLLLVQNKKRLLEDDNSTLGDGSINEECSLVACMGGRFLLTVYDVIRGEDFVIPISSCLETVGDVKKKIHDIMGYHPDKFVITEMKDNIPLVAYGIVRPYLSNMQIYTKVITMCMKDE